jgi:hypothetical protein
MSRFSRGRSFLKSFVASLAVCLCLLVGKTAYADSIIGDDHFNDYVYTNITAAITPPAVFSNPSGIGGGYLAGCWFGGGASISITNSLVRMVSTNNGADCNAISSLAGAPISSSGTKVEFRGVRFNQCTPNNNGGTTTRMYLGVGSTNTLELAGPGSGPWQSSPPSGFYLQIESDSIPANYGAGGGTGWDHNSALFYVTKSHTVDVLGAFKFSTISFGDTNTDNTANYSPVLDIVFTLDGANFKVNVTGDSGTVTLGTGTIGTNSIEIAGTYAGAGNNSGNTIDPSEIPVAYALSYAQTEGPGVSMSIDRIIISELGDFVISSPQFTTPDYPAGTNTVYAGEQVSVSSIVNGPGTLSYQWQQAPNGGGFVNIAGANSTNVVLNTTAMAASSPLQFQLVVSNNVGLSATSAVVTLNVNPATAPIVTQDTTPAALTNYVGGSVQFSAAFNGNHPITNQWQYSANGTTWNNISGATNTSVTVSNLTIGQSGYQYRLQAVNSQGTTASTPALLTVLASGQHIVWSAPVQYVGPGIALTANQILTAPPGQVVGAALFGSTAITVTNIGGGYPDILFTADGSVATVTGAGNGYGGAFGTNTTGNAAFDSVLGGFNPDGNPKIISLNGLTVGEQYSVQLFALDDRAGIGGPRLVNFQDPNDSADISATIPTLANTNWYIVGTFYASNAVETIQENLVNGGGNMNALVIRKIVATPPVPTLSVARSGSNLVLTWSAGTLLQATNLLGPWTTNSSVSPYTNPVTGPQMFFRVRNP